jgi:hypothetical protein
MSRGSCLARGRGTQTEIIDGTLINGVAHVWVQRRYDDVTMTASDGRVYRAIAHVSAQFVLIAPDFDNPVRRNEIIHVTFLGGPQESPGYLNERRTPGLAESSNSRIAD